MHPLAPASSPPCIAAVLAALGVGCGERPPRARSPRRPTPTSAPGSTPCPRLRRPPRRPPRAAHHHDRPPRRPPPSHHRRPSTAHRAGVPPARLRPPSAAPAPRPVARPAAGPPRADTSDEARAVQLVDSERAKAGRGASAGQHRRAVRRGGHGRPTCPGPAWRHNPDVGGATSRGRVSRPGRPGPRTSAMRGNVDQLHAMFMQSPGHRANIVAAEATATSASGSCARGGTVWIDDGLRRVLGAPLAAAPRLRVEGVLAGVVVGGVDHVGDLGDRLLDRRGRCRRGGSWRDTAQPWQPPPMVT